MFEKAWSYLNGKKTYLAAIALFLWAFIGWWMGKLADNEAWKMILEAAALAGLRHGISKMEK